MANPLIAGSWLVTAQAKISAAKIAPQGTASPTTLSNPTADAVGTGQGDLAFGTATGQGDILCAGDYTLAGGANVVIDLFANGLPNLLGGTANFAKLKGTFFTVLSGGDSAGVAIGGAASNATAMFFGNQNDVWTIYPSGPPFPGGSDDGVVIDATHRNIKILNAGAVNATVRVLLAGSSV
jgi:hypothetical protein